MSRKKMSRRQVWRMELQNQLIGQVVVPNEKWTMLDVGTEYGHSARAVKKVWNSAQIHGIEVHAPTFEACKEDASHAYASIRLAEAMSYLRSEKTTFDVVLAAEIIEHLPKEQGAEFLSLVAAKAKRLAIMTSPIGFMHQSALYGNPHQTHVSGWTPEEVAKLGWKTHAVLPQSKLFVSYFDRSGKCP